MVGNLVFKFHKYTGQWVLDLHLNCFMSGCLEISFHLDLDIVVTWVCLKISDQWNPVEMVYKFINVYSLYFNCFCDLCCPCLHVPGSVAWTLLSSQSWNLWQTWWFERKSYHTYLCSDILCGFEIGSLIVWMERCRRKTWRNPWKFY